MNKTTRKRVCILGNYSGRNAGDAAILGGLLRDLSSRYKDLEYVIPTLNPGFVSTSYKGYNVKPVNILPWHGSLKFLGFPTWNAIHRLSGPAWIAHQLDGPAESLRRPTSP